MTAAGLAFASTHNFLFLVVAGTIGVISPSGNEVGPFLPIEQAALAQVISARKRTEIFAWHTLTARSPRRQVLWSPACSLSRSRRRRPRARQLAHRHILYAALGLLLALLLPSRLAFR